MSSQIEDELRATFQAASDFIQPRAGLADRVRARSRRHRRRLTAGLAAATACVLVAAVGAYVAVHSRSAAPITSQQVGKVLITAPRSDFLSGLAVSGRYLYVETGPQNGPISLAAYYRASGRLVRRVQFPKTDVAEQAGIGTGGEVWVIVGPKEIFGPVRIWLFSPGLRLRSVGPRVRSTFLVPVGLDSAVVPVARGLLQIGMPTPGGPGKASEFLVPGTGLGRSVMTTASGWARELDGQIAVDLADAHGYDYHVVIAGQPSIRYGNAGLPQPAAVAGNSLWFANGPNRPLIRLNGQLKPTTPGFVTADPLLKKVGAIWSADRTIWVVTMGAKHLVCFPARSQNGPVVSLPVHGYPSELAVEGLTLYVLTSHRTSSAPDKVSTYQVPAACR